LLLRAGKTYLSLAFLALLILLVGCAQATPATPGAVYREETVALPTGAPTSKPTPVSTRVLSAEILTPSPPPTITPIPDEVRAVVVEVLDGDTIRVVMEGDPPGLNYEVRYLGIDAPPNTASIPWGIVAFETNRRLINGQVVRLERDQSEVDEEGRLLRYVYLDDELLSIILAEQGLARASITEGDTRFQAEIEEAEQRARSARLGLWGNPPTATPPVVQTAVSTATTTLTATVAATTTLEPETTSTAETETTTTIESEATTEETPAGSSSPTPTESDTTATPEGEADETTADTPTSEATLEPTSTSDSNENAP
jgi:micrococcal nuclease